PADLGPDGRVQVLSQAGARGDRPVAGAVQRVCVSDRNEREGMAQRVHPEGSPDRVRRPNRGAKQDESEDRPGSRVDGAPAQTDGLVRPHLVGTTIYKMTGSGNDFVMVDSRHTSPADWSVEDIRAVCARRTGVGDRKSTRLNSSHDQISYAVFCLKKKHRTKFSVRSIFRQRPLYLHAIERKTAIG